MGRESSFTEQDYRQTSARDRKEKKERRDKKRSRPDEDRAYRSDGRIFRSGREDRDGDKVRPYESSAGKDKHNRDTLNRSIASATRVAGRRLRKLLNREAPSRGSVTVCKATCRAFC